MKKLFVCISLMALCISVSHLNCAVSSHLQTTSDDSLVLWCSPDLQKLVKQLKDEYAGINPEVKASVISVSSGFQYGSFDPDEGICFVSKGKLSSTGTHAGWKMTIGREIYVFVVNHENPLLEEISISGISPVRLASVFNGQSGPVWGDLLGKENVTHPVTAYLEEDGSARNYLAAFTGGYKPGSAEFVVPEPDDLLNDIRNDKYALGFCRLADILDDEQEIDDCFRLVPIDINGNNKIDHFENIYGSYNDFARGVWIGKYPKELCGNIYSISAAGHADSRKYAFMEWLLTDGQRCLIPNGYTGLMVSEQYQELQDLDIVSIPIVDGQKSPMRAVTILLFIAIILVGGFLIFTVIQMLIKPKSELAAEPGQPVTVFNEKSVSAPGGLFYDKTHTWAFMEEDGYVRIGIDDFLRHIASPVTKIKMKREGEKIKKGEVFISLIQSGKQLDIYSPVSGIVKENNEKLFHNSSLVNKSPYSDGWICRIEPDNWLQDLGSLLMGEKYKIWLKKEFSRLKDFIASTLSSRLTENSQLILQDGGEFRDNLLECLSPEEWEKFQAGFIDVSK